MLTSTDYLNEAAKRHFGISYIFPYQRLVISNILEGAGYFAGQESGGSAAAPKLTATSGKSGTAAAPGDSSDPFQRQIAILPTGAGKSLCFMLPGLLLQGITLILFPLLSLLSDQKRRLAEQNIPAELLSGGQNREERDAAWKRLESGKSRFLLSNPETLIQPAALRRLGELQIDHLVIDEAHTLPMWGREFRPALLQIPELIAACRPKMTSAFTATASDTILDQIQSILFPDEPAHVIRANPDRPNISYHVIPTLSKSRELRRLLGRTKQTSGASGPPEQANPLALPRPVLVFCATRNETEKLAAQLRRDLGESEIYFYHAGLSREEKKEVEEWFFSSETGILTATTAYGMGVDKKNIRTVVHHQLSSSVEAFLQESGRAGRDGKASYSIVFMGAEERTAAARYRKSAVQAATGNSPSSGLQPRIRVTDRAGILADALSDRTTCVRRSLLALMGSESPACSGCDVCQDSRPRSSLGGRELLSFFTGRRFRYTIKGAVGILSGLDRKFEMRYLPSLPPGFAALSDWSEEEITEAIIALFKMGKIRSPRRGPWRGLVGVPWFKTSKVPAAFRTLLPRRSPRR